jgi:hypothetical protein
MLADFLDIERGAAQGTLAERRGGDFDFAEGEDVAVGGLGGRYQQQQAGRQEIECQLSVHDDSEGLA